MEVKGKIPRGGIIKGESLGEKIGRRWAKGAKKKNKFGGGIGG